jgi:hypothetical protein
MPVARTYHGAATAGGRWYVAGGVSSFGGREPFPTDVHVYDPASGHWTVSGQLVRGRQNPLGIADPLHERALFLGGFHGAGPSGYPTVAVCDVSSPDGVSQCPGVPGARYGHAVAFAVGKFVVSGGSGFGPDTLAFAEISSEMRDDAQVWDGASPEWLGAGVMPSGPRGGHTMTTLKNGREVLVAGGSRPDHAITEVDLLDAACGTWSRLPSMKVARVRHEAVLLQDGRVLVVGGGSFPGPDWVQRSAEVYDPTAREWTLTASMTDPRFDFDMVLLPDGRVLVAGGSSSSINGEFGALSSAEVYDPVADTWTSLPPMHDRRRWPTVAMLADGVYVAGGSFSTGAGSASVSVLASVERLAWSELGVTGPIDLDAGVKAGDAADVSVSCSIRDAGAGIDAAPQDAAPADAAIDVPPPLDAGDSSPSDRSPVGPKSGCACSLRAPVRDPFAELVLASVAFVVASLRRARSRSATRPSR